MFGFTEVMPSLCDAEIVVLDIMSTKSRLLKLGIK